MRIRTIKPEFWTNEKLCELPECVHMFAAAILNYADDEGYFNANPGLIKGAIFPLRDPSVSIQCMLIELSNIDYLRIAKGSDGREYGFVVKFSEHQRVNRPTPSKYKCLADFTECSVSAHGIITDASLPEQGTGNREEEQGRGTGIHAHARSTKTENDFDLFWKHYPKKVGKQDALKRFQRARKSGMPEIGVLVAAIEKQRKSDQWRRDNGQFIPNPSTWLNQGRWDDDLPEGHGRKLLPQEETAQMLQEWLAEKEQEENEQQNNSLLFADDIRSLPGKVETVEGDIRSVGKAPFRR